MGREKDAKGEVKAKHKATKLKKLSDDESAGAGGDAIENSATSTQSTEKSYNGKSSKKVKTLKKENLESAGSPR